jgi:hypothetical protein
MNSLRFHRVLDFFTGLNLAMGLLWLGLAVFTLGLLIIRYTRWGQSHKLEKCMALSVLAHLLMLGYAATISIIAPAPRDGEEIIYVAFPDGDSEQGDPSGVVSVAGDEREAGAQQPWEVLHRDIMLQPQLLELKPLPAENGLTSNLLLSDSENKPLDNATVAQIDLEKLEKEPPPEAKLAAPSGFIGRLVPLEQDQLTASKPDQQTEPTNAALPEPDLSNNSSPLSLEGDPSGLPEQIAALPHRELDGSPEIGAALTPGPLSDSSLTSLVGSSFPGGSTEADSLPEIYKLRVMPHRAGVARRHGATTETEKAVQAALKWLAENQALDGHWDASQHGAGRELNVQGRSRQNAGRSADAGVTGLALLACLASGNTHRQGPYAENVRCGLEYLLRIQERDGNLGGNAQVYEFMYCHAMATCALSEAYGMTHDPHLENAVRRAINYTIAAQDPKGGGWRYRPGDPGDTSQLGWQLMALKSAELAGVPIPASTRSGIIRFLQSVSSGAYGGLASYRPGERVSRTMTAEALVCWQFLGLAREHPACNEAGNYLLAELPGQGIVNDYYWYYATLGMYQLQGNRWEKWNQSMRSTLLERQVKEGPLAGSWNTDTLWGGYGGRVYTTALATLTLEVYYRFLPLYIASKQPKQQVR